MSAHERRQSGVRPRPAHRTAVHFETYSSRFPQLLRKTPAAIGSKALDADATQTALCTYVSAILLGGLLLNALVGWWWADSVAALIMVPIIVREGLEGIRGSAATTNVDMDEMSSR